MVLKKAWTKVSLTGSMYKKSRESRYMKKEIFQNCYSEEMFASPSEKS